LIAGGPLLAAGNILFFTALPADAWPTRVSETTSVGSAAGGVSLRAEF
jgi:hypothetical protein